MALNFSSLARQIKKLIHRHWNLVSDIPGCTRQPLTGYRKTKCLKQILTQSNMKELLQQQTKVKGHYKCGNCVSCPQVWETKIIDLPGIGFKREISFFQIAKQKCAFIYWLVNVGKSMWDQPDEAYRTEFQNTAPELETK